MVNVMSQAERRAAQLALYEPDAIERTLRQAANGAGAEYAAAIGMIQGTAYTTRRKGCTVAAARTERLEHIERILAVLAQVTGPTDLAVTAARVGAGLDVDDAA